ncbi:MAG: RDD family protein [Burkholderiales bacterium]|nr:RDD family protein [Burkholderiales bacterium]
MTDPKSPSLPTATGGVTDATVWRRFMCIAYEGVILFGVVFFFGYGFSALTQFKGQPGALRNGFQVFMFLVLGVYFVWFWANGRRTLPMKTMDVRLVDAGGIPIGRGRATARYLAACAGWLAALALATWVHPAGLLLAVVPFAWTLIDPQGRALYDRLCGSRLVTGTASDRLASKPPAGENLSH